MPGYGRYKESVEMYIMIKALFIFSLCIYLFYTFILEKKLNEEQKFYIKWTSPFFYKPMVLILILSLMANVVINLFYSTGMIFNYISSCVFLLLSIKGIYNRMKFGEKDITYRQNTQMMCMAVIIMMAVLVYVFEFMHF